MSSRFTPIVPRMIPLTDHHSRTIASEDNDPLNIIMAIEDDDNAWDFVGLSPGRSQYIADHCREREV